MMTDESSDPKLRTFCRSSVVGESLVYDYIKYNLPRPKVDLEALHFTLESFDTTMVGICRTVFENRQVTSAYVLSVLNFCVLVDEYCKESGCVWYDVELLLTAIQKVFTHLKFNPDFFELPPSQQQGSSAVKIMRNFFFSLFLY